MRIVAAALLAIGVLGFVPLASGAHPKAKPSASDAPRILYSSDSSGIREIYAVDPSGRHPVAQLTFGGPPGGGEALVSLSCGYAEPQPSPDGKRLLYRDVIHMGDGASALWVARADGSAPRLLAVSGAVGTTWSPDLGRIAYLVRHP